MQTLRDVVKWLEEAEESEVSMKTICLRAPWTADAEARVVELGEESRLPRAALSDGLGYFLETSVARQVSDVVAQSTDKINDRGRVQVASLLRRKRRLPRAGLQMI